MYFPRLHDKDTGLHQEILTVRHRRALIVEWYTCTGDPLGDSTWSAGDPLGDALDPCIGVPLG